MFTYYVIIFLNSQTEFCDQRSPQLVVAVGHNIFEVTGTPIHGQRTPQFIVPEVTDDYVICECSLKKCPGWKFGFTKTKSFGVDPEIA